MNELTIGRRQWVKGAPHGRDELDTVYKLETNNNSLPGMHATQKIHLN